MRSLYLTILLFIQVLLASFILYSTISSATPVADSPAKPKVAPQLVSVEQQQSVLSLKQADVSQNVEQKGTPMQARSAVVAPAVAPVVAAPHQQQQQHTSKQSMVSSEQHVAVPQKDSPVVINHHHKEATLPVAVVHEKKVNQHQQHHHHQQQQQHKQQNTVEQRHAPSVAAAAAPAQQQEVVGKEQQASGQMTAKAVAPVAVGEQSMVVSGDQHQQPVGGQQLLAQAVAYEQQVAQPAPVIYQPYQQAYQQRQQQQTSFVALPPQQAVSSGQVVAHSATVAPIVKGGLGPLHLLAATLCSYQPDKQVADETQNLLYSRRAAVRKSLFDFMSLKFTNLERFSSRLNPGLEVVPPKVVGEPGQSAGQAAPSHGWPVVGKCTAHDLKLMAEAAWCECAEESTCATKVAGPQLQQTAPPAPESKQEALDNEEPKIASKQHLLNRANSARSIQQQDIGREQQISAADKSAIISKILHVSDVKDAPVVESTIAGLNLTQQQLANIQAQATSTRECRKNALRMTKALLMHLAEDQRVESESWPKLYNQMASDECARKRMIDIISALSSYRTEATSIRRDNVEFAFAMDDLRTKVLESEVNVPLTFDKQFIEVGQFLQQSVKLMLTNIDPERAHLTSMRYRSLMPGPVSSDDQCIELHQRLLAKNYPTDCNPTQFGQLPDVLRMAASSLELWSIESELSRYSQQAQKPSICSYQQSKHDLNECIANLVSY